MTIKGYIRVSSESQNIARQEKSLKEAGCTEFYTEKISGATTERPQLQLMLSELQEGDTVIIHELSRLSRSTKDLIGIVEVIQEKKAYLKSITDKWLDLSEDNPTGEFIFTMFSALAQFERKMGKQRQKEGIAIAKEKGKFKGRKTHLVEGGKEEARMNAIVEAYKAGTSIKDIRVTFKVGTGTIYRLLEREGLRG
ncbi:recombinase family protein [Sporosarcina sp. ANT_H38]|uniref:recombinase family protein n=2 Tax=unclassified Sporosarcina TaxID=2647733 RepID=UPI0011F3CECA|nr:recombinase family protein [Sporosarcina sp. ANT_H38]KAA0940155.1 recombinase family protein [Sporosarcina sp. ANT_H38]QJS06541.1 MRS system resolvase [Sporosarcina sp.]